MNTVKGVEVCTTKKCARPGTTQPKVKIQQIKEENRLDSFKFPSEEEV
jgi:hypothetical protein